MERKTTGQCDKICRSSSAGFEIAKDSLRSSGRTQTKIHGIRFSQRKSRKKKILYRKLEPLR
ncbi:hypothetical protein A0128_20945 [Leptospira tipperaryensis]|uniref:Uncharacterized protein n=1 Tax=Leptospira tipperaryensis TaxID=2564040 RepID=A0A1D7V3S5_9LEPT|nr:hypothetical protein A0128_20945 [Leptospira tipperaryensis]